MEYRWRSVFVSALAFSGASVATIHFFEFFKFRVGAVDGLWRVVVGCFVVFEGVLLLIVVCIEVSA